jgi:anaerobic selenocysteine-containing dehydrogenase
VEMTQSKLETKMVTTSCGMCYIGCGVKVRVENGVVVNIDGNPDNPQNRGKMCAKGKAGFMNLYNPNRVKVPLKRTNPKKGIGEDPGWQEITWDEAMDTVVAQLERIRDNPKKLWVQAWEVMGDNMFWFPALGNAFGTSQNNVTSSPTCGKVVHPVEFFSGGGFHQQPDLHYADYCILVGTQFGFASRGSFNHHLLDMAEARARGMKLVVIDPVGGYAASKANEWLPIRPGTDAALGLSMLHVLLNDLEIYDAKFLADKTNAPYLIGANGRYVRDAATGKPLVFDAADRTVKTHDDPGVREPAILGSYDAQGKPGRPAFELLREHVTKYSPESTEKITTIPAATVRRIAREFGEAARIGATITIDGVELPYRPVCLDWARGTQGHKHGFHNCWPLKLLNIVVGSVNVPGGILSTGAAGKYPHHWFPEAGTDGMLEHGGQIMPMAHATAFPGRTPTSPARMDLGELFPLAVHYHTLLPITSENPSAFGFTERDTLEVLLHAPVNSMLSSFGDLKKVERLYQSLKFIVGFAVEINETTLFDDIVLPFPSALERYGSFPDCAQRAGRLLLAGAATGGRTAAGSEATAGSHPGNRRPPGHPWRFVPAPEPYVQAGGRPRAEARPALPHGRGRGQAGAFLVWRGAGPGVVPGARRHPAPEGRRGSLYRTVPRGQDADIPRASLGPGRAA